MKYPRPVHVEGHQESWDGFFHAWFYYDCGEEHQSLEAIIETENGGIRYVEPYRIKFKDRG